MANFTMVKVGYNNLMFEKAADAMAFYSLMASAVPVEQRNGPFPGQSEEKVGKYTSQYCRTDCELSMQQVNSKNVSAAYTFEELKERAADRADLEGGKLISDELAPREIEYKPSEADEVEFI